MLVSYSDGAIYNGNFKNGMKNGEGLFIFPNGNKYMGKFKNNNFHGIGVF